MKIMGRASTQSLPVLRHFWEFLWLPAWVFGLGALVFVVSLIKLHLCVTLSVAFILFPVFMVTFGTMGDAYTWRKRLPSDWQAQFGGGFQLWIVECPILKSERSAVVCGVSADEIVLVPKDSWSLARDWPLDFLESAELRGANLDLKFRGRAVLTIELDSVARSQELYECLSKLPPSKVEEC